MSRIDNNQHKNKANGYVTEGTSVMLIVDELIHQKSEFYLNGVDFNCVSPNQAALYLKSNRYDAVMILYGENFPNEPLIRELRPWVMQESIPMLLYSQVQSSSAKELALKFDFDDYHYGKINGDLRKKIEIIIKSKKQKAYDLKQFEKERNFTDLWKRTFDILVAGSALIVLLPVLLVVAIIIKLETSGPVFYISKRAGKNYRVFNFIKFRSMYQDADARLNSVSSANQYGEGIFIKIKDDPRVTPFGKILRKTSLDELPQLINVVKGDMSIVGNRPLPLYEARQLTKDKAARRFLAPAGVTGLWQVTKRGKEDMSDDERINLDIEYARKHSLWYDLKLIFNTIPAMIQKEAV